MEIKHTHTRTHAHRVTSPISLLISLHSKAWMIPCLHFKTFQFHLIYFSHHFLSAFHWLSTGTLTPYSVQFSHSVVYDSLWPHGLHNACFPVHHQLPEFTQTHLRWVGDTIQPSILYHPLLLLPSVFSSIRVFSNKSVLCIRWPKYWCFSFTFSPSSEYSGLVSFRMDLLDLLEAQGTLKSLQHHSSKASILWCLVFFRFQASHPYVTTGKTVALTRWTFVGKEMSLFFNIVDHSFSSKEQVSFNFMAAVTD